MCYQSLILLYVNNELNFIIGYALVETTWYTYGSILCVVSAIHWGSWNMPSPDKEGCCTLSGEWQVTDSYSMGKLVLGRSGEASTLPQEATM